MSERGELRDYDNIISLVDPWELFEPANPALKKIADYISILAVVDEEEFYRNIDKVMDIVCAHFNIKRSKKVKK